MPANRLSRLPPALSHWLGYRSSPPPKRPDYIIYLWSFIGAFGGIALIQAVFGQAHYFIERKVPPIVASYGATAVLIYGAVDAPLAQPRALFGGHFIGALVGVCVTKLFHLLPTEERFQELVWLSSSLSCALAVVAMQVTGTTHPPAGATALLASFNADIRDLGWYYLPVVLLTSTLALAVALLTNNIQRRYPVFWFQPPPPPKPHAPASAAPIANPNPAANSNGANASSNQTINGYEKSTPPPTTAKELLDRENLEGYAPQIDSSGFPTDAAREEQERAAGEDSTAAHSMESGKHGSPV